MASYISSSANRLYVSREAAFGRVPEITAQARIPAVSLTVQQQREAADRKDKTGTRTFGGLPAGGRKQTKFELHTYLTSWPDPSRDPAYGSLVEAALGGAPMHFAGAPAAAGCTENRLVFAAAHSLSCGQAVTYGNELRFVSAVPNATSVSLNAPFSSVPASGAVIGAAVTYGPATELPSATIFDYWTPASAVQRLVCGAAVNRMKLAINGDYHELQFQGAAQDVIDSATFSGEAGELQSFPTEPAPGAFDYSVVPGHLGQAWLGNSPDRFFTITGATFLLDNDLEVRAREFGSSIARRISPGRRTVTVDINVFEQDDDTTKMLYQAARQQSPISVAFQLGEQQGQLMGLYLKSVMPEVPEFDDSDRRLQWRFKGARAQGTGDDEVFVAFG